MNASPPKSLEKLKQDGVDVIVVGAGIAGIAAAHALVGHGAGSVLLIDEAPPLSLTSDKSTECWRNFWPGPDDAMLQLVDTSIQRMMAATAGHGDPFIMRQPGYLFATARADEVDALASRAEEVSRFGGGAVRTHGRDDDARYPASPAGGIDPSLDGFDLITEPAMIARHFPYLAPDTVGALHVRRCGSLSAQQLGMWLLDDARAHGLAFATASFKGIETGAGALRSVVCEAGGNQLEIPAHALVLAPGPHLKAAARHAGTDLPVEVEAHTKISLSDKLGVIPRNAPLTIWNDEIALEWSPQDRAALREDPATRYLTEPFPAGVHGRPLGAGDQVVMYWTYDCAVSEAPAFPMPEDELLPEVTLRGMARMVPGLTQYLDPMPRPYVDGGYYTKTADNRPLIGPLATPGTFVFGAFSGYGIMASFGAGEILAAHVLGSTLPGHAAAFRPSRFNDAHYLASITELALSAQL